MNVHLCVFFFFPFFFFPPFHLQKGIENQGKLCELQTGNRENQKEMRKQV